MYTDTSGTGPGRTADHTPGINGGWMSSVPPPRLLTERRPRKSLEYGVSYFRVSPGTLFLEGPKDYHVLLTILHVPRGDGRSLTGTRRVPSFSRSRLRSPLRPSLSSPLRLPVSPLLGSRSFCLCVLFVLTPVGVPRRGRGRSYRLGSGTRGPLLGYAGRGTRVHPDDR